jgi:hypothetical protein
VALEFPRDLFVHQKDGTLVPFDEGMFRIAQGSKVITPYGLGTVVEFVMVPDVDETAQVALDFGTVFMLRSELQYNLEIIGQGSFGMVVNGQTLQLAEGRVVKCQVAIKVATREAAPELDPMRDEIAILNLLQPTGRFQLILGSLEFDDRIAHVSALALGSLQGLVDKLGPLPFHFVARGFGQLFDAVRYLFTFVGVVGFF